MEKQNIFDVRVHDSQEIRTRILNYDIQDEIHYVMEFKPSQLFEYNSVTPIKEYTSGMHSDNHNIFKVLPKNDILFFISEGVNPETIFKFIPNNISKLPNIYMVVSLFTVAGRGDTGHYFIDTKNDVFYYRPKYVSENKFYVKISDELKEQFKSCYGEDLTKI